MERIFNGKKALVIGGSGGIGAAVAAELAKAGADMLIHGGHSESRLTRTLNTVRELGGKARGLLLALEGKDLEKNIQLLMEQCPNPDILVFAWGSFCRKALHKTSSEDWMLMGLSNLVLPGALVSALLPHMIEQKWGRILLFGGTRTHSIRGFTNSSAYSAAKSGLGVLAASVAQSTAQYNVSCNVLCPGFVETEYMNEEDIRYALKKSQANRLLTPEEIARSAMHVLQGTAINGACIPIDGGLHL